MNESNPPSKEELKRTYNISNDDFEILDSLPKPEEVHRRSSFLVKLGEVAGAQAWMWKSWTGRVIAIALIYIFTVGAYDSLKPVAVWSYDHVPAYLQKCKPYAEEIAHDYVAFVQHHAQAPQFPVELPTFESIQAGTSLFPITGSMLG